MAAPEPKDIRECYKDYREEWESVREEASMDLRAISVEGPWADEDRESRRQTNRPCIHLDQINQYLNQFNGNLRKNKRGVKVNPKGDGASQQDAELRGAAIMGIEDRSQAQPIYLHAAQCMVERSYGFAVIRTEYEEGNSFNQNLVIKPVHNPDTVLLSPHYKQPDASDIPEAFFLDRIAKKDFKKKYPQAKVTDFSGAVMGEDHVSDWVTDKTVQVAEFWRIEHDRTKLFLVDSPQGPIILEQDEWEAFKASNPKAKFKRERTIETPRVVQYMTNGLEILDEVPWAGTRIPIISCLGPERWVTEGGSAKRQLLSMVRFARDPQMLYDYYVTQECELAGMVPKTPFVGYKGQFESDKEAWTSVTKIPHAFVQTDLVVDGANGQTLPLPQREEFSAPFQEYEVAKDAATRALQASMGISPLPDAAQRRNQKSGVALDKIDDMESLGTFHFVDRYENCFLYNVGWQLNELLTKIYDTERQMPITQPDGTQKLLQMTGNTSHPLEGGQYDVQGLPEEHLHTGKGEFDVTISTGPSYASEREEQSAFVDQLLDNLPNLPQPNTPQSKVLALAIRMRPDLGPIGKEIADVFDPPDPNNLPPQAQAVVQQLQGQLQQAQQENTALHMDRAGRVLEQQTKLLVQQMKEDGDNQRNQLTNDIKVLLAEVAAKAQSASERAQMYQAFWEENHSAAHDVGLEAMKQQHATELATHQAALQPQAPPDQQGRS